MVLRQPTSSLDLYPNPCTEINSRWRKLSNVKKKETIKMVEEKMFYSL